ncbi:translation initiation factor IF-2-like [Apodemus sylvaticus]|uniref:translation initiation factor IF-2-like n=1 Tax=Apodemus sylvaticus TaxID=10129 RepID=UPI0022448D41|nr:translation initiation factor IF-2-like [Apodemus sylvaticus]
MALDYLCSVIQNLKVSLATEHLSVSPWPSYNPLGLAPLPRTRSPASERPAEGADPRPAARRAGPLAQARRSGRRIRAALPLTRPASFLPSEPGRTEVGRRRRACCLPCAPAPPRALPRGVPPGWGSSRANPGRAAVGAVPGPAVPPAWPASGRPASGVWGSGKPRRPRSNARGGPRRPARRPQTEPPWLRSEAELCRGRAGYIVSSPRTPSRPLPPPFFPPRLGLRGSPPACLAGLPPSLFASIHLFVPHPLGTLAPLPSPLAAWTVLQATDAARGEEAWTAVPPER